MRILRYVFLAVAVTALAISLGYVGTPIDGASTTAAGVGNGTATSLFDEPAPAAPFDIEELDGTPVSSEDVFDDILLLDFWATWCGPCLVEIPHYNAIHSDYDGCGVRIMGITMQSGAPDRVRDFVSAPIRAANGEHQMEYPIYMGNDAMATAYGPVFGFPTTILVGPERKIRKRWIGALPNKSEQIRVLVDALLEEQGRTCEVSRNPEGNEPPVGDGAVGGIDDEAAGTP